MRVPVFDAQGRYISDKKHNRCYVELQPCPECKKHRWTRRERVAIRGAVRLVYFLENVYFIKDDVLRTGHFPDSLEGWCRSDLLKPLREPFEYNSEDVALLQRTLLLAAFAGTPDINVKAIQMAYGKVNHLFIHISNELRNKKGTRIAQYHDLRRTDFGSLNAEQLLGYLHAIKGKSEQQLIAHLKTKWVAHKQRPPRMYWPAFDKFSLTRKKRHVVQVRLRNDQPSNPSQIARG